MSLIWKARWNTTKILYFLARYLPFIDTSIVMYRKFALFAFSPSFQLSFIDQFGFALPFSVCKATYEIAACKSIYTHALMYIIVTLADVFDFTGMFITGMACAERMYYLFPAASLRLFSTTTGKCTLVILTLRTWAVWEKDRRLTYGLPVLFGTVWTTGFVVMEFYLRGARRARSHPLFT